MTNPPKSLLDLPAELRNEIYHLAFEGSTTGICIQPGLYTDYSACCAMWTKTPQLPGILRANKQLRDEATKIYYATTEFVFTREYFLVKWLKGLDLELRSAVQKLCYQIAFIDLMESQEHNMESEHDTAKAYILVRSTWDDLGVDVSRIAARGWSTRSKEIEWTRKINDIDQ